MEFYQQVITDEDDIYIYFEVIRALRPASILDFGMTLKRMGSISRQAMHCEIPRDTRLDGIDFCAGVNLPIYEQIYDRIYDGHGQQLPERTYDLAIYLCIPETLGLRRLEYVSRHAGRILFDAKTASFTDYFVNRYPCQSLQVGERLYGLAVTDGGKGV